MIFQAHSQKSGRIRDQLVINFEPCFDGNYDIVKTAWLLTIVQNDGNDVEFWASLDTGKPALQRLKFW